MSDKTDAEKMFPPDEEPGVNLANFACLLVELLQCIRPLPCGVAITCFARDEKTGDILVGSSGNAPPHVLDALFKQLAKAEQVDLTVPEAKA